MVLIPIFSRRSDKVRRKGGGGGGKGGGSSGSSGGKSGGSSSSSGGKSSGSTSSVPVTGLSGGRSSATAYGTGGGKPVTIPSGSLFAGRQSGGASRGQVFGTSAYGSGYPGLASGTVVGRGFPFGFWPIVWGTTAGVATAAYLDDSNEYGAPDNSSRPGGVLLQAPLQEPNDNTTYHLVADNSTLTSLLQSIEANCTLSTNNITPQAFNPDNSSQPQPVQAIQYYRASSITLTLDGYNNTAAIDGVNTTAQTPLPSGLNTTFLDCVNQTIGAAAPLIGGASPLTMTSTYQLVSVGWLLFILSHFIL